MYIISYFSIYTYVHFFFCFSLKKECGDFAAGIAIIKLVAWEYHCPGAKNGTLNYSKVRDENKYF